MAYNDLVLLDSIVQKRRDAFGSARDETEIFELFSFEQLIKDFDLSYEELEAGWVDGGDDGGIDGFFVLLNGRLLNNVDSLDYAPKSPIFDIIIITTKRGESFKQAPLNTLCSLLPELFDLRKDEKELKFSLNQIIIDIRKTFRRAYLDLAGNRPTLHLRVVYACRADTSSIAPNVHQSAELLEETLKQLFSDSTVHVELVGASELLDLARRKQTYSLSLRFIESTISRERTNYVLLSRLKDYYDFITDEKGSLRRYLFESNVRDYLGEVPVNRDISETLSGIETGDPVDFWWLNNGVTLLASYATIAGKQISLENVEIVNGLQTTESIYRHLRISSDREDDRALLVKIIVTEDAEVRDRIIKATNYQNPVGFATLRATDRIQRDIEHFLADHGWYYDRRKNYYKNQGVPADRIISMGYLAAGVRALALRDPVTAVRMRSRFMREDEQYSRMFNPRWDLGVFLVCVELMKRAELGTRLLRSEVKQRYLELPIGPHQKVKVLIAFAIACEKLGRATFKPEDLLALTDSLPTDHDVRRALDYLTDCASRFSGKADKKPKSLFRLARSKQFIDFLCQEIDSAAAESPTGAV